MKLVNKTFLLVCFSLFFSMAGFAQGKLNIAEQVSSVTEFEVNGLKVLLKKRSNAPTVSGGLFIRGGVRNITDANAGIESLMLEVSKEGSKKYPTNVTRRELSRTGGGIGASVSNDYSVLTFGSTRQYFDNTWNIFADMAMNPTFAKDDVERVRGQILSGLREAETNNDNFLEVLQSRIIYANHPYANKMIGTVSSVQKFTPSQLRTYHKKIMNTSRLLLVVVGDIDPADLRRKVKSTLAKLPLGNYKEKALPKFDFSKRTVDITSRKLPTNYIRGIFDAPSLDNPDYYPMRVAVTVLNGRLFQEVRERRQLSYAANATLDTFSANTANIYVTAVNPNRTVTVMLNEIKGLKRNLISERTISGVAGQFLTNYYLSQETNAAQAGELAKFELIGGGWRNSFEFLNRLRQVKPEDVRRVSRKYMKNLRFVVIGDPVAVNRDVFMQKLDF